MPVKRHERWSTKGACADGASVRICCSGVCSVVEALMAATMIALSNAHRCHHAACSSESRTRATAGPSRRRSSWRALARRCARWASTPLACTLGSDLPLDARRREPHARNGRASSEGARLQGRADVLGGVTTRAQVALWGGSAPGSPLSPRSLASIQPRASGSRALLRGLARDLQRRRSLSRSIDLSVA